MPMAATSSGFAPACAKASMATAIWELKDLLWIVLDPSGLGKDLLELLLSHGADGTVPIEQKSPGTGRALI